MRINTLVAVLAIALATIGFADDGASGQTEVSGEQNVIEAQKTDFLNYEFQSITGDTTSLADFKGKVILLVNVASRCGNTPQYEGLEKLYETYKDSGLVVIGFPANNFAGQEPGTNEAILEFCQSNYGVTFPMMAKISVKGEDKHPLYRYLTEESDYPGEIGWNFAKFLLNRKGEVVARFEPKTQPLSDEIVGKIRALL
ncbi:MAG: glutathione peroxidase [bacterium]